MKVRVKVNLKVSESEIIPMGTVYSDVDGEFPDFITENLEDTRFIEVLDASTTAPAAPKAPAPKAPAEPKKPALKRK